MAAFFVYAYPKCPYMMEGVLQKEGDVFMQVHKKAEPFT
jgi:hypothetical protein